MTDSQPIACSLGAGELSRRVQEIAAVGAESLIGRGVSGGAQVLRFRPDPAVRSRLERIVAAEAKCCPFLDLELGEAGGELVLTISAPSGAEPIAEQLALAFGEPGLGTDR